MEIVTFRELYKQKHAVYNVASIENKLKSTAVVIVWELSVAGVLFVS